MRKNVNRWTEYCKGALIAYKDVCDIRDTVQGDQELMRDNLVEMLRVAYGPPHFRMGYNAFIREMLRVAYEKPQNVLVREMLKVSKGL